MSKAYCSHTIVCSYKPYCLMPLLFQSVAVIGTWGRNNLDNMKVMLVAKGRRLDSVGRAVADPSVC